MRHLPTYQCWQDMKQRCLNPNRTQYKNYGARGIKICDRWMDYENFLADMGEKPATLSIERIDNNGNYEPTNCRWATRFEQRINQRTCNYLEINGVSKPLRIWAKEYNISEGAVLARLRKGLRPIDALSLPIDLSQSKKAKSANHIRWHEAIAAREPKE